MGEPRSKIISSDLNLLPVDMVQHAVPFGIIVSCPNDPDFIWGNFGVVGAGNSLSVDDIIGHYRQCFNDKIHHLALIWDCDAAPDAREYERLAHVGVEFDVSNGLIWDTPAAISTGHIDGDIRVILDDADWQYIFDLQIELLGPDAPPRDISVIHHRLVHLRTQCEQHKGRWFGAFKSGKLVADAGIFLCGKIARFQHVETRDGYRGQGYCRALIGAAIDWIAAHHSGHEIWIEADEDSAAAQIYRHLGFQQRERLLSAFHADLSRL